MRLSRGLIALRVASRIRRFSATCLKSSRDTACFASELVRYVDVAEGNLAQRAPASSDARVQVFAVSKKSRAERNRVAPRRIVEYARIRQIYTKTINP